MISPREIFDPEPRVALANASLGLAVLKGKRKPDITTTDAFRQALLSCSAVAYSRAGASGIYFEKLIDRSDLGETVRKTAVVIPSGLAAEKLISGEADLAIQQISELIMVDGVEVAGPLPQDINCTTGFSAAVLRSSLRQEQAKQLVASLSSDNAMKAYAAAGLSLRR